MRSSKSARGFVVVTGPDGSGKSTLAAAAADELHARGVSCEIVNFRPHLVDRARSRSKRAVRKIAAADPHATVQLSRASAIGKCLVIFVDLVLGAWRWQRRSAVSGHCVLVERYAYDLVVDPHRLGISRAPRRFRAVLARSAPAPRAILLCTVDAETAVRRKPELHVAEVARQYGEWSRTDFRSSKVPFGRLDMGGDIASAVEQVLGFYGLE